MANDRPRVLIVDDEPSVLQGLQLAFEGVDWHIDVAISGATALEKMPQGFDLVITDKNLPDIDGVELIRRVREKDTKTRFVMITGYGSLESAVATANLGIEEYIEKPFRDIFEVRARIEKLLEKKRPMLQVAKFFGRLGASKDAQPEEPAPAKAGTGGEGVTVLVASAEVRARKQITEQLDGKARAIYASSGKGILEEIRAHGPTLVLVHGALDVVDLVQQIREAAPEIWVVVATEELDLDSAKALIALGVTAIINHTIDSSVFGDRLRGVLKAAGKSKGKAS